MEQSCNCLCFEANNYCYILQAKIYMQKFKLSYGKGCPKTDLREIGRLNNKCMSHKASIVTSYFRG